MRVLFLKLAATIVKLNYFTQPHLTHEFIHLILIYIFRVIKYEKKILTKQQYSGDIIQNI